ncbi:MAG TPA: type I glyceraldehyde-3-phosphate dehydrogenase [Salinisphaeraceae bacterium]|nr:type I glyceraldehyde-3-phosphate dehydrogenase [Salinisphaeraceae bacterium]
MAIRVAINGYGRIGRNVLRALYESGRTDEIQIVAINGSRSVETSVHLTRYDTTHGRFPGDISIADDAFIVNGDRIRVSAERDLEKLSWQGLDVDLVIESTGKFNNREQANAHLRAGARKVLFAAPAGSDVPTIVYGVNHDIVTAADDMVSNASCTTNCLAPLVKPLHETFGIEHGLMTTVHAYTNDQVLTDANHKDLRRARAAAQNIIPTSSGAARSVGLVLPELDGRLDGFAVRVPTANVSFVDLTARLERDASAAEVNAALEQAAAGALNGVLAYTEEPLVSSDYNHDPASAIVDGLLTKVLDGRLLKVCAWYDNEWAFSHRMLDAALVVANAN